MQVGYIEHESGGVKLRKAANDRDQDKDFVRGGDFDKGTRVHLVEEATAPTGTKYWKVRRGFAVGYVKQAYVVDKAPSHVADNAEELSDEEQWSEGMLRPPAACAAGVVPVHTPLKLAFKLSTLRNAGDDSDGIGDETDEDFIIDYISDHRKRGRMHEYLVVWQGYGEDEATWEPAGNIPKNNSALKAYLDAL